MSKVYFTEDHEWVSVDGDIATIGITDHAQEELGDIVFIELPEAGKTLARKDEAAVVESVKAASEVYAPVSGEVVETNQAIVDEPGKVNADPQGEAWFIKVKMSDPSEVDTLMDEDAYKAMVE